MVVSSNLSANIWFKSHFIQPKRSELRCKQRRQWRSDHVRMTRTIVYFFYIWITHYVWHRLAIWQSWIMQANIIWFRWTFKFGPSHWILSICFLHITLHIGFWLAYISVQMYYESCHDWLIDCQLIKLNHKHSMISCKSSLQVLGVRV